MTGLGVGPAVVDQMDGREMHDLMDYWADHPPAHIAAVQLRDVVITALGGKPPALRAPSNRAAPSGAVVVNGQVQSPESFAAMLGVKLEASGG